MGREGVWGCSRVFGGCLGAWTGIRKVHAIHLPRSVPLPPPCCIPSLLCQIQDSTTRTLPALLLPPPSASAYPPAPPPADQGGEDGLQGARKDATEVRAVVVCGPVCASGLQLGACCGSSLAECEATYDLNSS